MTELTNATVGLYFEWLRLQGGTVERLGKRFRPWEEYALENTDLMVRFESANEDNTVNVLTSDGEQITVDPDRLELWCIPALDATPQ